MNHSSRRTFLVASGLGLAGLQFGAPRPATAAPAETIGGRAKSTILFFLCGGSSHIDMWDLKPHAPLEYRGEFQPIATSAPGLQISEHLPLTAKQGHHLAVIRSIDGAVNTNDHHAGYYHNLTGHRPDPSFLSLGNNRTPMPDDWPYMGCVVGSRRPPHPTLTNAITLPFKPSRAPYTRPGQFAAKLGVEFDPLYVDGNPKEPLKFHAPSLVLETAVNAARLTDRHALLQSVDAARRNFDAEADPQLWSRQQERAVSLLMSSAATDAFDVSREPPEIRARYGDHINATSLLLARRLVEAGVPFVTVFWVEQEGLVPERCKSGGGWDTHGSNFACLREDLLPIFDRGFSALIGDLHDRGLLETTTVLVTTEMGRKPKIGDPRSGGVSGAGRDHWTYCLSDVMAGGGIRGGQAYGTTDKYGEYPADNPVTPADVAKTVYHAMGVHDLAARDCDGRTFNLLANGEPIVSLF